MPKGEKVKNMNKINKILCPVQPSVVKYKKCAEVVMGMRNNEEMHFKQNLIRQLLGGSHVQVREINLNINVTFQKIWNTSEFYSGILILR